jgi:hypothetical protein
VTSLLSISIEIIYHLHIVTQKALTVKAFHKKFNYRGIKGAKRLKNPLLWGFSIAKV